MAAREGFNGRLGLLVLAVVVLLATLLAWKLLPAHHADDVFVIGDSVTYISAGAIQERLDQDDVQFVAHPGFTSTQLLGPVVKGMGEPGGVAAKRDRVIALVGYNDVRIDDIDTPSLRRLVDATAQFDCGIWLTLPARPAGRTIGNPSAPTSKIEAWNRRLATEVARHDNLHLAKDWEEAVDDSSFLQYLQGDDVHPNRVGADRLASVMGTALDRECRDADPAH